MPRWKWSMGGRGLPTKEWMSMAPTAKGLRMPAFAGGAENTLATFPGVHVELLPRRKVRSGPVCPSCRSTVSRCPYCNADIRGTEEKGVDTRITTAMVSLAWIDNYDVALLVSPDRDFVPVVEFLATKGKKAIHGAFPPSAAELTRKCWGSFNIPAIRERFRRSRSS